MSEALMTWPIVRPLLMREMKMPTIGLQETHQPQ